MTRNKICALLRSRGFTLLEVMVALAIISIALTAIFHMQSQTVVLANSTQFYTVAPLLADQKMTELIAGIEDRTEGEGDFGEAYAGYRWRFKTGSVELETLGQLSNEFKRIEVTVALDDDVLTYTLLRYHWMSLPK